MAIISKSAAITAARAKDAGLTAAVAGTRYDALSIQVLNLHEFKNRVRRTIGESVSVSTFAVGIDTMLVDSIARGKH